MPRPQFVVALLVLAAGVALFRFWPRGPSWPSLPRTHFVSGRAATSDDVHRGDAAFALVESGRVAGTPADILIPQYAWVFDRETPHWDPAIVIQAERDSRGCTNFGIRYEPDRPGGFHAIAEHVVLLGTSRPTNAPRPGPQPGATPPECRAPIPPSLGIVLEFGG